MAEKRGGRHGQSSRSLALGSSDPRTRRSPQFAATDSDIGDGLELVDGRIAISLADPLYIENGTVKVRATNGITIAPGSPLSLQLDLGDDSLAIEKKKVVARPKASQVRMDNVETSGPTLQAALDNEIELLKRKNSASGYAGLDASAKLLSSAMSEVIALTDLSDVATKTGSGTKVVMADSPTIVTPTVASFTNATHQHTNAAGGGQLTKSALSDAFSTPGASRIPVADGSGTLNSWITAIAASIITSGTLDTARLGSGSASSSTFLRGDQTWASPTGRLIGVQTLTSGTSATYTPTSGATQIMVFLIGAGGGGGGAANTAASAAAAGGGGSGGLVLKYYSSISASYTYTIGTGGAAGAAGNNNGSNGGNTTFDNSGTVITAKGGSGGTGSAAGVVAALVGGGSGGGVGTNGTVNGGGAPGGCGRVWSATVAEGGTGGSGLFGGGGASRIAEANGIAGSGKGSGGSGGVSYGTNAKAGGAGTDGIILIWEFT